MVKFGVRIIFVGVNEYLNVSAELLPGSLFTTKLPLKKFNWERPLTGVFSIYMPSNEVVELFFLQAVNEIANKPTNNNCFIMVIYVVRQRNS